jgi:tyrosyl-tRNA synthetase
MSVNSNVFDELKARGFIAQVSNEEAVRQMLGQGPVTFYIGYDCTAASLHAGSLVPIMAMAHLRRAGHRALAIIGGGTTMVGDPSGKTEMRRMLTEETIRGFGDCIQAQLDRYLDFDGRHALAINNADWLLPLNYVEFLRDIGRHFSVNRMLAAEAYKMRLEKGLSFIEFNYQLLQAYDFLHLFRTEKCTLQMGGDDQWGNILAGVDLVRRVAGAEVQAMTFPLLTTSGGAKMGKTAQGAVWLDSGLCSPYDFYQYWVNCDDRDVGRFLRVYTFVPLAEIARLENLAGSEINEAKRVLAFEATRLLHGEAAAAEARSAAGAAFGPSAGQDLQSLPTTAVPREKLEAGIRPAELFTLVGLTASGKDAKRMIEQGGLSVNDEVIASADRLLTLEDLGPDGGLILKAGKKKIHRIVAE